MSWLAVGAWGAVVGLDATSFPQTMISRPLVAGAVTGLLLGSPVEGAAFGALVEVFALTVLPVGAARTPEPGTASVAGAAAYLGAAPGALEAPALLLALVFALGWERLGGASVHLLRRVNERIAGPTAARGGADPRELEVRHLIAMALDLARGALVTLSGVVAGRLVVGMLAARWAIASAPTAVVLSAAAVAVLAGAVALFGGWKRRPVAFGLGLLCGIAALSA